MKVKTEHKGGEDRGHTGHKVWIVKTERRIRDIVIYSIMHIC